MKTSLQKTFDRVAKHLLKQGKPAVDARGNCMYRGVDGLKCAVGCLIPDSLYQDDMENLGADTIPVRVVLQKLGHDVQLCVALQYVHDNYSPKFWANTLIGVAAKFDLDDSVVRKRRLLNGKTHYEGHKKTT